MKLSLRLREILEERDPGLPRGVIKRICDHTELERHQVAALVNNRARYLSLDALSAICNYLIEFHKEDPANLPGKLFAWDPGGFWNLVARRHVEVSLGVRSLGESRGDWVVAHDSYLHGALLHEISNVVGTARHTEGDRGPYFLEQRLVSAVGRQHVDTETALREARAIYDAFDNRPGDRAIVHVGSMKSNVSVELCWARAWGAEPFVTQDDVAKAKERACPVFFCYRPTDPKPPSCAGGLRLSRSEPPATPGLYYERADGQWEACPWDDTHDAGVVFYAFNRSLGRLEMVIGGFSGRATACLARVVRARHAELYPPPYTSRDNRQIGLYVVRFRFRDKDLKEVPLVPEPVSTKIEPLPLKAFTRRLGPPMPGTEPPGERTARRRAKRSKA